MTNADHAQAALDALAMNPDPNTNDAIVDLLADLRHACDLLGLDYAELDRIALSYYRQELTPLTLGNGQ